MEEHYKNFVTIMYKFINDYNRYLPSEGAKKALEVYNNLDMAKVIFRTYHLLKDNLNKIQIKDESLFNQPFIILPDIDISKNWTHLSSGQKNKLFTYLHILVIESEILMDLNNENKKNGLDTKLILENSAGTPINNNLNPENNNDQMVKKDTKDETLVTKFNPYVGIGGNIESYGVEDMFSSVPTLEEDKPLGAGIESIANMIGINKMINIQELSDQLKNMKKEDIDNATNNIKNLLGTNIDEKTTTLISDMLSNISDELKKNEMGKGDPFKNILNIAEVVAGKMKPKIINDKIDVSQLINSTQSFANQCKDKDGNPMFSENMNPFNLLNRLAGNFNNENVSEEKYMKECNDMLKNMGMGNLDIQEISNNLQKSNHNNNKKSGKRKKKN